MANRPVLIWAPAAVQCHCGETINLQIPVLTNLYQDVVGTWRIGANVDDTIEWAQPAWDHAIEKHGPADDGA